MQQPGFCLWLRLRSHLPLWCLKGPPQSCKDKFCHYGSCSCNNPRSSAEQSWCQWEEGGRQDPSFLRWQILEALAVSPSCEEIGTISDHSGSWESLHKGNKPAAAEPFSERHQCPQGENTRSAPGGRFPQTRNLL